MTPNVTGAMSTDAPAKVNLGLHVATRRADGYHELRSVFLRLDLADRVRMADAPGGVDTLTVEGDDDCPIEDNLALRASAALRAVRDHLPPISIRLEKRIPMAAGLAGGSSDAAAILRLLGRRFSGIVDDITLARVAASVGSDVPFFLSAAGAALVSGVGELVEPLPPPIEPLGVVLVMPPVGLSTREVFGAWDAMGGPRGATSSAASIEQLAAELRAGATPRVVCERAASLRDANDLWSAAVMVEPRMSGFRAALEAALGRPVLMTGSGSTLVAVYPDAGAATSAARALREDPPSGLEGARVEASASGTPYPPVVDIEEEGA